ALFLAHRAPEPTITQVSGPRAKPPSNGFPYRELFEHSPSGLVLTRVTGEVVGANATSRRMLGEALRARDASCCTLLGCREPGTALADACVSELAGRSQGPLPEVRVDVPQRAEDAELASAWVIGARVALEDGLVLLQLRPGAAGDRRRRTEPHWIIGPRLRVY